MRHLVEMCYNKYDKLLIGGFHVAKETKSSLNSKWGQMRIINSVLLIFFGYDRKLGDLYHVSQ